VDIFPWDRAECIINPCHGGRSLSIQPGELSSKQLDFVNFQKVESVTKVGHKMTIEPAVILVSILVYQVEIP
jgi:hypothetical protein